MRTLANRWLLYADADRRACDHLLESSGLESIVAFHAQQSIEKSFKVLLVYLDEDPPRVHDLTRLAFLVSRKIQDPTHDSDMLARITQYYTQSRYPLAIEAGRTLQPSREDATAMVAYAKRVYEFVKKTISEV